MRLVVPVAIAFVVGTPVVLMAGNAASILTLGAPLGDFGTTAMLAVMLAVMMEALDRASPRRA